METPAKIFACTQSTALGKAIADHFGIEVGKVNFSRYSDGEFQPSFEESVRGARIFIIGSTQPSSENLMEMLLMLSHERARCATVRARDGVIGGAGVERVPVAHAALRRWDVGEARTASGGASRGGAAGV